MKWNCGAYTLLRFLYVVVACVSSWFLFIAELYSIVQMCHSAPAGGHLDSSSLCNSDQQTQSCYVPSCACPGTDADFHDAQMDLQYAHQYLYVKTFVYSSTHSQLRRRAETVLKFGLLYHTWGLCAVGT